MEEAEKKSRKKYCNANENRADVLLNLGTYYVTNRYQQVGRHPI